MNFNMLLKNKYVVFPIVLVILVGCLILGKGCRRVPYSPQLVRIDSLLNEADVDTAKVLAVFGRVSKSLDGLDTDNRMYYNLLTQYYMFKTYQPVKNDSILKAVLEYYGDKPIKEGLLANYIATGIYNDQGEYENAQVCGLRFLRMTDKTSDFDKVMRAKCHLQLSDIYYNHLDSLMVLEQCRQAAYWAEQTTDTMLMADCYYFLSYMYGECKDYNQSMAACNKACQYYSSADYADAVSLVWLQRAKNYMELNDLAKAKLCIGNYETMTSDFESSYRVDTVFNSGNYYGVNGQLYEKLGNTDSAFKYYYLEFASSNENFSSAGCGHLVHLYGKIGEIDSGIKYNLAIMRLDKRKMSRYIDKNMQRKQVEYDMNVRKEKELAGKQKKLAISILMLSVVVFLGLKRRLWIKSSIHLLHEICIARSKSDGVKEVVCEGNDNSVVKKTVDVDEGSLPEKPVCDMPTQADGKETGRLCRMECADNPFMALQGAYGSPVDYSHSKMFKNLKIMLENGESVSWKDSSWRELEKSLKKGDAAFEAFRLCLWKNGKRITPEHIRVCILIRVGFQPNEISKLLSISQSATTNIRRNLAVKILGNPQSKAEELDNYIRQL